MSPHPAALPVRVTQQALVQLQGPSRPAVRTAGLDLSVEGRRQGIECGGGQPLWPVIGEPCL